MKKSFLEIIYRRMDSFLHQRSSGGYRATGIWFTKSFSSFINHERQDLDKDGFNPRVKNEEDIFCVMPGWKYSKEGWPYEIPREEIEADLIDIAKYCEADGIESGEIVLKSVTLAGTEVIMILKNKCSSPPDSFPLIKGPSSDGYGYYSTDSEKCLEWKYLMRETRGGFLMIYSMKGHYFEYGSPTGIEGLPPFDYSKNPYSCFVKLVGAVLFNCFLFLDFSSKKISIVSAEEVILMDPKAKSGTKPDLRKHCRDIDVVKISDFEYVLKIDYEYSYGYHRYYEFRGRTQFNFIKKEWSYSSYTEENYSTK